MDTEFRCPKEVSDAYAGGHLCLFVGAGVSWSCGLPKWNDLAKNVIKTIWPRVESPSAIDRIYREKTLERLDPLESMRYVRRTLGRKFKTAVAQCLYSSDVHFSNVLNAVVSMRKVRRICCFNFDDILEAAFEKARRDFKCIVPGDEFSFASDTALIFHPHGYLPRRRRSRHPPSADIVLSEDDYHELYAAPYSWPNVIQLILLLNYTVLYVGCSLRDPNQRRLLDVVAKVRRMHPHYALLPDPVRVRPQESEEEKLKNWMWMSRSWSAEKKVRENDLASRGVIPIWWRDTSDVAAILGHVTSNDA